MFGHIPGWANGIAHRLWNRPLPMVRIPRHIDPVPQAWRDRYEEKLWRARVHINQRRRRSP